MAGHIEIDIRRSRDHRCHPAAEHAVQLVQLDEAADDLVAIRPAHQHGIAAGFRYYHYFNASPGFPLPFGVEDAIANMRVIDALFRSERSGRWEPVAPA